MAVFLFEKEIEKMNKIKEKIKKAIKNIVPVVGGVFAFAGLGAVDAFATSQSTESVTKPLKNLLTVFEAVIAGIGAIILLKNIVEAVQAYQQQDSSGMYSALKGVVAGAIMCAAGLILAIIGIPGT